MCKKLLVNELLSTDQGIHARTDEATESAGLLIQVSRQNCETHLRNTQWHARASQSGLVAISMIQRFRASKRAGPGA
jgi:hypothetical protein